ncbi:MAG TPA: hypothetical protein VM778_06385 [Gemmatimonadota bacterium]|nr:hypothetical protein [Gemmatimonadota bacterium]
MCRRFDISLAVLTVLPLTLAGLTACQRSGPEEDAGPADTTAAAPTEAGVVEMAALDYAFRAPAEIPSGWTTFRLRNEGAEHHLLVLWKMPEGRGVEDYKAGVVDPFSAAYDSLMAGTVDEEGFWALFGQNAAPWSADIVPMGGPGLIAPGLTAVTTVELEPGTYVMECYVKAPDGEWHTNLGMLAEIAVTAETTGAAAPRAGLEITLTNAGIETRGGVSPGENTVAVHYAEHPEAGLGNDVHLARLEEGDTMEDAVAWTNWRVAEGLRAPSPVAFLGGAQEMPVGHTSYITVDLVPGRYVWLSEATRVDGLVEEFTVE